MIFVSYKFKNMNREGLPTNLLCTEQSGIVPILLSTHTIGNTGMCFISYNFFTVCHQYYLSLEVRCFFNPLVQKNCNSAIPIHAILNG
jgi:hypothetical protein